MRYLLEFVVDPAFLACKNREEGLDELAVTVEKVRERIKAANSMTDLSADGSDTKLFNVSRV